MKPLRAALVSILVAITLMPSYMVEGAGGQGVDDITPILRFKKYQHIEPWENAVNYLLSAQREDGAITSTAYEQNTAPLKGSWEAARALDLSGYTEEAEGFWEWMRDRQIGTADYPDPNGNMTGAFYGNYRWNETSGKWESDPTLGEGGAAAYIDQIGYYASGVYGHYLITKNATWLLEMWPSLLKASDYLDSLNRTEWGYTPDSTFWVGYVYNASGGNWYCYKGSFLEYDVMAHVAYRALGHAARTLFNASYAQRWFTRAEKIRALLFTRWWHQPTQRFINSISDIGVNDTSTLYFNQYVPALFVHENATTSEKAKLLSACDQYLLAYDFVNTTDWLGVSDGIALEYVNTYYSAHLAEAYIHLNESAKAERLIEWVMSRQLEDGCIPDIWYPNGTMPANSWKVVNVPSTLATYANIRWQLPIEYLIYRNVPSSGNSSYSDPGFNRTTIEGVSRFDMWIQTPKNAIVRVQRNGRNYYNWKVDTSAARLTISNFVGGDLTIRIVDPHPFIVSMYNAMIALIAAVLSVLAAFRRRLGECWIITVIFVLVIVILSIIIFAPPLARRIVQWTEGATPA